MKELLEGQRAGGVFSNAEETEEGRRGGGEGAQKGNEKAEGREKMGGRESLGLRE